MEIRSRSCFVCLMLAVSACFMATTAFAQYQGIWKDTADPPSHNFYIQHYSTGSTIVIHTSDAITFHAFLADISGNRFEADSLDADRNMHLVITFTTGSLGTATLTDNNTGASVNANVEKKFAAVRTMHSGVWKDADSVFNMYVQDYETGSTVIVYTFDAVHFEAFLGKVDLLLFTAQNMDDQSLEMDMMFTSFDEGTVTVEPEATTGYRPWAAPFTYDLTKVFQPGELDIDILCTPASGPSPLEVAFTGASTITFISWSWDFGDGGTSTQQNPQHTYSSPGTYTAVLTMSNPLLSMTCIASEPVIVQQPGANPVIGGTVTLSTGGGGLAGVTLTAGNGGGSTTTDSSGAYSITVTGGWSGTLTPSLSGYTFNPASQSFTSVTSNKTQNFTATPDTGQNIAISGTITASGAGLSGVNVVLSTGESTTTSASGAYSFTLAAGWSGVVTPSLTGYTFTPGSQSFTNVTSNRTQNFTASAQAVTISGTVTLSGGGGIGMVQIEFQNLGLIFTDSQGNYSYDVPYNWAGTVTPYKENYSFTPSQAYPNGVTSDLTGMDFVGSLIQQYMPVSGNVTDGGSGLGIQWVQISLQGWGTTSTDAQGTWSTQVPYGWGGSISASLTGYTFWPVELILSSVTSPATGIDFTGTAVQADVTLSGTITDGSQGVSGVILSYTGDSANGAATTDATGHYSFTVPSGWSGYASPSKPGWTFAPPSIAYSNQTTDSVQSYTGFPPEPTISGTVTADPIYGGGPLSGVEVIFTTSGGGVWAVYTDNSGYYSTTIPYNWTGYWVASLTNWTFSPTNYNAAWVIEDIDIADFVGQ